MSPPSADAFLDSLRLAPDGPRLRTSTRSPSPRSLASKIQFSSPPPGHGIHGIRRQFIRRLSNHQPTPTKPLDDTHAINYMWRHSRKVTNETPPTPSKEVQKHSEPIDWEIPRKTLHSSIGFFTIFLYTSSHESPRPVILVLWAALAVVLLADILRLRCSHFARVFEKYLGFLMRESERRTVNGVIWYILGVNFVLSVYPLDIAVVAILILSWADTAASTIGRLFGSYTPALPRRVPFLRLPFAARKSLAGFLAASLTGALVAMGFWGFVAPSQKSGLSWHWDSGVSPNLVNRTSLLRRGLSTFGVENVNTGGWIVWGLVGLVAGLVTGVAEALDLGTLDDNLTLPVISGGCLLGFFKLLGSLSS